MIRLEENGSVIDEMTKRAKEKSSGTAVQILCDLLCELGVWDEGEQPEV